MSVWSDFLSYANAILNNIPYEFKLREYGLREIDLGKDIYRRSIAIYKRIHERRYR